MSRRTQPIIRKLVKPHRDSRTVTRDKIDRNDPCPCGSGKKFKKCCYQENSKGLLARLKRLIGRKP